MNHQDWKPVVFRKTNTIIEKPGYKGNNTQQKNASIEKRAENDTLQHKKITPVMRTTIQKARTLKGLTQKELATQCRFNVSIINEIESGKAIYNAQHIEKIKRVLNIKFN